MNGQPFSDWDREFVKENYRKMGCRRVANYLGRSTRSIYSLVASMRFTEHRTFLATADIENAIKELHPLGRTDTDIVNHLLEVHGITTDRHRVGNVRRKLGLGSNASSEYRRAQVRAQTKVQLTAAGFEQLCDLRIAQWNGWKRSLGWPETLTVRAVQALECFWQLGPAVPITRLQLCAMMGIESPGRTDPKSNAKGGTVLAELGRAGFIAIVHKSHTAKNGKPINFYYLKPGVQKNDYVREESSD